jgi:flagellar protein FliO/FliZ
MLMLAVVVGIAYLTLHKGLGKLVARQNLGRRIKVVERVSLDPKRTLFLVELDGKQMLLGAGEGGVVHLKDLGATTPTAPTEPASFAAALEAKRSETT